MSTVIRLQGVLDGMPEAEYHAHPALSVSGAKKLLPPSCPALFKHDRDHGQQHRAVFDMGHAAHKAVLGVGAEVVYLDAPDWRSKKAQEWKAAQYEAGAVPMLAADRDRIAGMAYAILAHPKASALLQQDKGRAEVSLFGVDKPTGTTLRARVDWLPELTDDGRLILTDYKTTASAEPRAFGKAAAQYGYHAQASWYMDLAVQLGLCEPDAVEFRLIAQEKVPPYLITVAEFDDEAIQVGRARNRQAIDVYAECVKTDTWPGYTQDVELLSLPAYMVDDLDAAA